MRNPDDYTPEQWARIFGVPVERVWQDTQPTARRSQAANAPQIKTVLEDDVPAPEADAESAPPRKINPAA